MSTVNRMTTQRITRWYTIAGAVTMAIVAAASDGWYLGYHAYSAFALHVLVYALIGLGLGYVFGRLATSMQSAVGRSTLLTALSLVIAVVLRDGWYLRYHYYTAFASHVLVYALIGLSVGYLYGRFSPFERFGATQRRED